MKILLDIAGTDLNNLLNAHYFPADGVILDLTRNVPAEERDATRILVRNALQSLAFTGQTIVKINDMLSDEWKKDLACVLRGAPDIIMITAPVSAEQVQQLDAAITDYENGLAAKQKYTRIGLCLDAQGITDAKKLICASDRVAILALKTALFDRDALAAVRGLKPIEIYAAAWADPSDEEGCSHAVAQAAGSFDGVTCIYPTLLHTIRVAGKEAAV